MDGAYDFNAPSFADLTSEESYNPPKVNERKIQNDAVAEDAPNEMDCNDVEVEIVKEENVNEEKSLIEDEESLIEDEEEEMDYCDEEEKSENSPILMKKEIVTPAKRFVMNVSPSPRQSPRLIAISKEIRRRKADRGFMPPPSKGVRRRSLSEGGKPRFTKVEKKPAIRNCDRPLGALMKVDEEMLHEIAHYTSLTEGKSSSSSRISGPHKHHYMKDTISQTAKDKKPPIPTVKETAKGPTKVQPFKFSSSLSKPKESTVKPFVSLAELNMKFFTKTPDRFRTRSTYTRQKDSESKLTTPHTPKLTTRTRTRSKLHYPTHEEIEEKEFEESQKHKFKANPLNKNALKSPSIPTVAKKTVTVPTPFDIIDEKRKVREVSESVMCTQLIGSASSLASLPHSGIHVHGKKTTTTAKPFSFEARDSGMPMRKLEKIQKERDDRRKKAEFHAQPMPYFESKNQGVPLARPAPVTKVQPFNMESEPFRKSRLDKFQQEVKELQNEEKQNRQFHASEPVSVRSEPFVPELPRRTLEDISGFELNTAKRAEERESFNMQVKQKEDQLMAQKRERQDREEREADEEVKQLRKDIVHLAQPIRHYTPVEIKLGVLPLTCPISPNLRTKKAGDK